MIADTSAVASGLPRTTALLKKRAFSRSRSRLAVLLIERDAGQMQFDRIAIGVLYGIEATLTDKFRIASGIGSHDPVAIQDCVDMDAGRNFWAWL